MAGVTGVTYERRRQERTPAVPNAHCMGIGGTTRLAIASALSLLLGASFSGASASAIRSEGTGEGLKLVAEVPFEGGTHQVLATIKGRDYAFVTQMVTSGSGNLRVVDITAPSKPRVVATVPCGGNQGNVQLSHDQKTLVIGLDSPSDGGCMPAGLMGFVTLDISNPRKPRPIGWAEEAAGSHSLAAHPTKPFVYNGEGFPDAPGRMSVWSIADPAKPKLVKVVDTGAHSPHDLAFNRTGSMLATANVFYLQLMDTRDPAAPKIVHTTQCPGCVHTHEARFTPDGKRLIVNDEYPSAACPGGAVYFYDIVDLAGSPGLELTGSYTADEVVTTASGDPATKCTPHIFDISSDGTKMAATWHEGGIKYLDISETSGVTAGPRVLVPGGPTELGWYLSEGSFAFSAKLHKGPYIYVVDGSIGFQVFRIDAGAGS